MMPIRAYAGVTAAYWAFTLTDGALRMLVLLHFNRLGYSPFDLALLFLLYEFFGIVTNAVGGWIGVRLGLKVTLFAGLFIQVLALVMLSALDPAWPMALSVAYVMAAQALSGIAKDLTKMSSKSAVKLVAADGGEGRLFRWVAALTGSKNALKGIGFFLGGLALELLGFRGALWGMAGALALVLALAVATLSTDIGKAKEKVRGRELWSRNRAVNILSAARIFLFAARDVWFVVGLPLFLAGALGWGFAEIGAFMAAWVIGYGLIQALAPILLRGMPAVRAARLWGFALAAIPAAMALGLVQGVPATGMVLGGLCLFGLAFAVNSSVHSYLILAYSDFDKVALNVGFYYMANAAGRLGGTLLSGVLYQWSGLAACLWASAAMVSVAAFLTLILPSGTAGAIAPGGDGED